MTSRSPFDIDVLIVGSGPMGATTALALATYGVQVQVVSRSQWTSTRPKAHITNQRAAEVLRDLGVEQQARKLATPWNEMGDMIFTTSLAGPELGRLRAWGTGHSRYGDYLNASPCELFDLPQHLLEPLLISSAASRGVAVTFGTEYLRHEQDSLGVSVHLRDGATGTEYSRRARYLIGADGASSQIAQELGLPIEGELARAGTIYAHFRGDLSSYVSHRPSILHWILSPAAGFGEIGMGLLRAVKPWSEWIAGWGFDLSRGDPDLDVDNAVARIKALVGDPTFEPVVERVSPWYVNRAYATQYSSGRVFCGGDAVHRHPPSSGLGSNTCIQDAHNLAWKVAYNILGYAGPRLLDSYTRERAPVGKQVVARANRSRIEYGPLREALLVDPWNSPDDQVATIFASTSEGALRRQQIRLAMALKNYEFNAHGVELNQRYESTAVLPDDDAGNEIWARDPELYAQATTRPGAKLPHAWLVNRSGTRISTLDVVGKGKLSMITGLSGISWVTAVEDLALPFLHPVVIGSEDYRDAYFEWADRSGIDEAGALLIRPDGVVAWRQSQPVNDARETRRQLVDALARLLDLDASSL